MIKGFDTFVNDDLLRLLELRKLRDAMSTGDEFEQFNFLSVDELIALRQSVENEIDYREKAILTRVKSAAVGKNWFI